MTRGLTTTIEPGDGDSDGSGDRAQLVCRNFTSQIERFPALPHVFFAKNASARPSEAVWIHPHFRPEHFALAVD
ncbi:MAG: hypothetical protein M3505_00825 [Verrucomicrobiota bacterium]|nr:hypothetical protein [Chthoniobacterales bacterium]MDQ3313173.1 hypothetical protein [Verrucomicrobiota bacterium]